MGQRELKICKTCGKEMKVRPAQGRKQMCSECAYEIKKIRSSERYWNKKDPKSVRYTYWKNKLDSMLKAINK